MGKYGDSPFLYPLYGLGGLPESFSRLCAIHGGTYMLNTNVNEILFDADGRATGVRCNDGDATAPLIICDPSYVAGLNKTRVIGKVIRAICIMDHPIPSTNNAASCQIILPQKQLNRNYGKSLLLLTGRKLPLSLNLLLFANRYLHHHGFVHQRCLCPGLAHCYCFNHCRD